MSSRPSGKGKQRNPSLNNQFSSNKHLSAIDPNRLSSRLVSEGKLLRPKADYPQHYKTIFESYSQSLSCVIVPNTITLPTYKFESSYHIFFQYKIHQLKQNRSKQNHRRKSSRIKPKQWTANDYVTRTKYAYYYLGLKYEQLSAIAKFIKQNNKFFADLPYPTPDKKGETVKKRRDKQEIYEYEEKLLTKPTLPSGPSSKLFGKKKSMTQKHLNAFAEYLHNIFASPILLLQDELYEILNITDNEIITLFKTLALQKIESLKSEAIKYDGNRCMRDPTKLKKKPFTFHTLWIVKRPLNNDTAKLVGCDHWALKFEGNDELMTVGFFSFNKQHGIILTKIVPNTPLNRRLFWYYWPRDNEKEIKVEHFNERWTVLEKIYLREMSCELVGELIEEWLKYDNHAVYELAHNNCQHFARDFVAPLDIKIAKRLSASFDVRVAKSLVPAGILAEGIDAEAKCNNIHARLWPVCERYKKNLQRRQQQQESVNDEEEFKSNFDFIAQQLGINLSSSEDEDESQMNKAQIIEEEKKIEYEVEMDVQDSLTFYQSVIKVNPHGNEVEDDEEGVINIESNNRSLQPVLHDPTVSPSGGSNYNGLNQSMDSKH